MAIDFVHTGQIVDQVIAVLKGADGNLHTGGLPANWFPETADDGEVPLKLLEHGDLVDYARVEDVINDCPAILVRGFGPRPSEATGRVGKSGVGGVQETEEVIRVVHVRAWSQCRDDDGVSLSNMTRARERYAKTISTALFHDPHRKLAVIAANGARTEADLTCEDPAGARIINVLWDGWDLGQLRTNRPPTPSHTDDVRQVRELATRVWAIACDLLVIVRSGGNA